MRHLKSLRHALLSVLCSCLDIVKVFFLLWWNCLQYNKVASSCTEAAYQCCEVVYMWWVVYNIEKILPHAPKLPICSVKLCTYLVKLLAALVKLSTILKLLRRASLLPTYVLKLPIAPVKFSTIWKSCSVSAAKLPDVVMICLPLQQSRTLMLWSSLPYPTLCHPAEL
jgi:hypothetical protein